MLGDAQIGRRVEGGRTTSSLIGGVLDNDIRLVILEISEGD